MLPLMHVIQGIIATLSHQTHVPDPAVDAEQLSTQTSINWQYPYAETINLETQCMPHAGS